MAKKNERDKNEPIRFEDALEQLGAIVEDLEGGRIGLNDALARYEQGVKLLRQCHEMLDQVERKIEILSSVDAEGNPVCAPLDDTSLSLDEKARQRSRRRTASGSLFPLETEEEDEEEAGGSPS